jgi:hypothetical protein
MAARTEKERPSVGWRVWPLTRDRWPALKGDWSSPPSGRLPALRKLLVAGWPLDYRGTNLDCLRLFPKVEQLRVRSHEISDISGVYHLTNLRALEIHLVSPKNVRLDLSRFPNLRSFSASWSHHLTHLESLSKLSRLDLDHVYEVKHFDFSCHPDLKQLCIGPAKGVQSISLDGVHRLEELGLACMPRLTTISGRDFPRTVTFLDIRGSHSIPRAVLASFTSLKKVWIGMSSKVTASSFSRCRPKIVRWPV